MTPLDDRGLTLGDGLFETVLALDGVLVGVAAHLDRMAQGCAVLGLPMLDRGRAQAEMQASLAGVGSHARVAVRLTLTAGSGGRGLDRLTSPSPRLFATAAPAPAPAGPARLLVSTVRRNAASPTSRLKSLSYLDNVLARREASGGGCDEAVMLNAAGEVACAAAANIFWLREGRIFTPALACGVLAGTMRARVMAASAAAGVQVIETHGDLVELEAASAAFLTNALIGVRPVERVGTTAFDPSALVQRLADAVA
ncbi:MAG: aminotransferase class IV [Phenylobacterium sp.]|uniref:aminotransferase class IV n=1 Tax=Phenylobacterium sp. TaxID=1871053 RepID=UPI00273558A9|nr:aminotransferase class IV [Phenylobacterium sp.]MDP3175280.1 aminotransferase class IV [Phenylobacterium sp.]